MHRGRLRYVTVVLIFLLIYILLPRMAAAQTGSTKHTVQPGDRLADIAISYGTSVRAIMQANGLTDPDIIWSGQVLIIPEQGQTAPATADGNESVSVARSPAPAPATSAIPTASAGGESTAAPALSAMAIPAARPASAPAQRPDIYTVQAGDTLARIAQRYGTTASAIARLNGLTSPDLVYLGMKLQMPGSAAGSAGTPASGAQPPAGSAGTTAGSDENAPGSSDSGNTGADSPDSSSSAQSDAGSYDTSFVVSISQQHCWVYRGDRVMYSWTCSTGRPDAPTVPGTYEIQSKIPKAWGSTWSFWMPYWLGIYWAGSTENGIHGLPYTPSGRRTWEGLVGTPITYGCVMLDDENAKILYRLAYYGMPVIINP